MASPAVPDEILLAAVNAYRENGNNQLKTAEALGVSRGCLQDRLRKAAAKGLDGSVPEPARNGQSIGATSTLYRFENDPNGKVLQWVKASEESNALDIAEAIKGAFADFQPAATVTPAPDSPANDLLSFVPANDWHIGMYAWGSETGQNWDLKIAERTIGESLDNLIHHSPSCGTCIVLGGGDLLHADNQENKTAKSGNALDVDGRYPLVLETACRLTVRGIDSCLKRHGRVIVRILRGNHDEHAAVAVAFFLKAWYRNEPRVTVDTDPSLFFWHRFGSVMLGATHGHTVKLKDMASIMAHRRAEDWGATKFRYVHGFHIHHHSKIATEGNGVISESHQAPIPQDAWHYGAGFLSGRSLQAITYHRSLGEISRNRIAILDGA